MQLVLYQVVVNIVKELMHNPDIAFEFASWLSPEFKMYLIKEFERLKQNEAYQQNLEWHAIEC